MSSGIPIAALPRLAQPELVQLEPHLVEVIIPFSTGTVDEAVAQTQSAIVAAVDAAIDALLTQPYALSSRLPTSQPSHAGLPWLTPDRRIAISG